MKNVILLLLLFISIPTLAQDWNFEEVEVNGETQVRLTQYLGKDTDIIVPAMLDNKKVYSLRELLPWGAENPSKSEITSLDFSQAIHLKVIERSACSELTGLTSHIEFPNSLEVIENDAFFQTTFHGPIHLHEGFRRFGDGCFNLATGITEFLIPASTEYLGDNMIGETSIPRIISKIVDPSALIDPNIDPNANMGDPNYKGYSYNSLAMIYPFGSEELPELVVPAGTKEAYTNHPQWGAAPWLMPGSDAFSSITEAVATSVTNITKSTSTVCYNGMIRLQSNKIIATVAVYNVLGVQVNMTNFNETQVEVPVKEKGILLVKTTYKDGTVDSFKLYN